MNTRGTPTQRSGVRRRNQEKELYQVQVAKRSSSWKSDYYNTLTLVHISYVSLPRFHISDRASFLSTIALAFLLSHLRVFPNAKQSNLFFISIGKIPANFIISAISFTSILQSFLFSVSFLIYI